MPKTKLAKVSITPKGAWDSATAYEQLDLVSYDGGSWVAKKPSTGVTPRENDCWMKAAEKGEKGDTGATGDTTETAKASYIIPRSTSGYVDFSTQALCPWGKGDALAFLPPENSVWEETIDGGETWTVKIVPNDTKRSLFGGQKTNNGKTIKIPTINNKQNELCGLRVTFTGMRFSVPSGTTDETRMNYWNADHITGETRYAKINGLFIWVNTAGGNAIKLSMEYATYADPTNWKQGTFNGDLKGYDGGNFIRGVETIFGGYAGQTEQPAIWRLTFFTSKTVSYSAQNIYLISGTASSVWASNARYAFTGNIYDFDYVQNVTFPAALNASGIRASNYMFIADKKVEPDGKWEKIETITTTEDEMTVERTADTNGTAYNFRRLKVCATAADGVFQGASFYAKIGTSWCATSYYWGSGSGKRYMAHEVFNHNGYWDVITYCPDTSGAYHNIDLSNSEYFFGYMRDAESTHITGFRSVNLKANVTLTVYAIRA